MPKKKRRDANHFEVVKWLKGLFFSVQDTSQVGDSFPDLVVAKHGINVVVEIKTDEGKLEPGQVEFMETWRGPSHVIRTMQDCIDLDNHLKRQKYDKQENIQCGTEISKRQE